MRKIVLVLLCVLIGGSVLVACSTGSTSPTDDEQSVVSAETDPTIQVEAETEDVAAVVVEKTLYIAPYTELCEGVAEQECLLVRESLSDEWEMFPEQIEGFQYIAGFNYKLLVLEEELLDPPADGSSLKYTLGEILSQEGSFETQVEENDTPQISTQIWHLDYLITSASALQTDITLEFGEGQVSGSGGCNDYVASFTILGDNQLVVESIGASRKLCDELISQQERDFFDALAMVATFEQSDASKLVFQDESGTEILAFVTSR